MKRNVTVYDLLLSCPGDAYESCYTAVKMQMKSSMLTHKLINQYQ